MSQAQALEPTMVEDSGSAHQDPITLEKLVGDDLAQLKKWIGGKVGEQSENKTFGWTRRFLWLLVRSTVNAEIDELMRLPVSDSLGQAYLTLREVQKRARSLEKKARKIYEQASHIEERLEALLKGESQTIPLKKQHLISFERDHEWQLETDREVLGSLTFHGEFDLDLTGAELGIAGVSFEYVDPGDLTVSGEVRLTLVPFAPPLQGSTAEMVLQAGKAEGLEAITQTFTIRQKKFGIVEGTEAAMELSNSDIRFDRPIRFNPPIRILPESLIRQLQPPTETADDSSPSPPSGPPKGAKPDSITGPASDEDAGR